MKLRPIHWLAIAAVAVVVLWWLSRPDEGGDELGEPNGSPMSRGRGFGVIPGLLEDLPGAIAAQLAGEELPAGAVQIGDRRTFELTHQDAYTPAPAPAPIPIGQTLVTSSPTGGSRI